MNNRLTLLFFLFLFTQSHSQESFNYECSNAVPIQRNGKWGTIYSSRETRIPFIYDKLVGKEGTGIYIAYLNKKAGLIDCNGEEMISFEYSEVVNQLSPFGYQQELYMVTRKEQNNSRNPSINDWGVINLDNKEIIPLEYGYVRVIDPQLIVTRKDNDSTLYFFSNKGKYLYSIIGKSVEPGFDSTTIRINQFRGKHSEMYYKSGEKVITPQGFTNCLWTDKNHFIVVKDEESFIIDRSGKQVSPSDFVMVEHITKNDFYFYYPNYVPMEKGLFRINEGIIIEPKYYLTNFGNLYFASDIDGIKMEVLDKNGRQLLPMKKYWTSKCSNLLSQRYQKEEPFDRKFMIIEDQEQKLVGLLSNDGKIVLPINYRTIQYAWENYPIIVSNNDGSMVYDNQGNQILSAFFLSINYTSDPNVLIVRETMNGKTGLLYLDRSKETQYIYTEIEYISKNCLKVRTKDGGKWELISLDGEKIGEEQYSELLKPEYRFYE